MKIQVLCACIVCIIFATDREVETTEFYLNSEHCGLQFTCSFDCSSVLANAVWRPESESRPQLDPGIAWDISKKYLDENSEFSDVNVVDVESIMFLRCGEGWIYIFRYVTTSDSFCNNQRSDCQIFPGNVSVAVTMDGSCFTPDLTQKMNFEVSSLSPCLVGKGELNKELDHDQKVP